MATAKTGRRTHTTGPQAKATPPSKFTEAQCEELRPFIVRAALAAVRQSEAADLWNTVALGDRTASESLSGVVATHAETCAAGKALGDAMRQIERVTK
jgi:hypothetical protein